MKYTKTNSGDIATVVDGKCYQIKAGSDNYSILYAALRENDKESFLNNFLDSDKLNIFCEGYIQFDSGEPTWDGVPMPDLFTDRIIELVTRGEEFEPIVKFTINLAENPSEHSILELIDFLRNKHLPITKDGCFLAYKAVQEDYKDIHSGTIDNSVGNTIEINRADVDDNRSRKCSHGLHVGAIDYVTSYGGISLNEDGQGQHESRRGNKIVIVKVNPKNVVSVPKDHSFQKLRCCKYTVISDFENVLTESTYDDALMLNPSNNEVQNESVENIIKKKGGLDFVGEKLKKLANLIGRKIGKYA